MKSKLLGYLKLPLFFGIGILLIWLAIKDLSESDKQQIITSIKNADFQWLLFALVITLISHVSRAVRWNMLITPLGYKPSIFNSFAGLLVGYLANLAVPRLGEVSRCGVLQRYDKIPFHKVIGTVIAERLIDVISLLVVFLLAFLAQMGRRNELMAAFTRLKEQKGAPQPDTGSSDYMFIALVFFILAMGVLLLYVVKVKRVKISTITKKVTALLKGFFDGLTTITKVRSPLMFIGHSVFIWLCYCIGVYGVLFALDETSGLGIGAAFSLLAFGSVAMIVTPGGIGAYPAAVLLVLTFYGVDKNPALAMGWLLWVGQTATALILGFFALISVPIVNRKFLHA